MSTQLFDADEEGRRRSILFTIGTATGFICLVAATSAFVLASANLPTTIALGALGVVALGFASLVVLGQLDSLVENDQLLWRYVN